MPDQHFPAPPGLARRRAHAKVNLALRVGPPLGPEAGPKAGFHPIASWFACIGLWDDVEVTHAGPGEHPPGLDVAWDAHAPRPSPIDWPSDKDLCVRAWRALERRVGRELPARIVVRKRIPVGAGLGGGSADAAATLLALRQAFALHHVTGEDLRIIGAGLGSDVPFFVDDDAIDQDIPPRPALVRGLGERIERLPRRPADLLLLMPAYACPTPAVYRALDASHATRSDWRARWGMVEPGTAYDIRVSAQGRIPRLLLGNDLEDAACQVQPALAQLIGWTREASRCPVQLTGSGSTVIVHLPDAQHEVALATSGIEDACERLKDPVSRLRVPLL